MSELELIEACLARADELEDETFDVFTDWKRLLEQKRISALSPKRRNWLDGVCTKLGIDPGAANLVSSGVVKPSARERDELKKFHESLGPKVLKPPGR